MSSGPSETNHPLRWIGRWLRGWWAPVLFVVAGSLVTIDVPYDNSPPIRSDGLGYHAWTRVLLDGNVSFCDYEGLEQIRAVSPRADTWRCANKYAPGLALLRFPVMGWFTAANDGGLRSPAEDAVSQWMGVAAGTAAVALTVLVSRRLGASALAANLSATAAAAGAGLFHYSTYDGSFTHAYSAALVGLLILAGDAYRTRPHQDRSWPIAGVAVASWWLVLIRVPSVLVVGAVGAVWAAREAHRLGGVGPLWREHQRVILAGGGAVAIAMTIHMAYASYVFGELRVSAYSQERFFALGFNPLKVIGSIERGLFVWYPIVGVALLAAAIGRRWTAVQLLVATIVPLVLLYGSWQAWDLGGGFGHRGFVELVPLVAVALALGLSTATATSRSIGLALAGIAVFASVGLMRAYWSGDIGFYGADAGDWVTHALGERNIALETVDWLRG